MNQPDVKVLLRAPEPDDIDFLYRLENERDSTANGCATAPISRLQIYDYIENYNADAFGSGELRLIAVDAATGERVGAVDLTDFSPRHQRAYVGIAVDASLRRRGYGRAAISATCIYAADTLGIHTLAAVVASDNKASLALFATCGFRGCGRLRSWVRRGRRYVDAQILQRMLVDCLTPANAPANGKN